MENKTVMAGVPYKWYEGQIIAYKCEYNPWLAFGRVKEDTFEAIPFCSHIMGDGDSNIGRYDFFVESEPFPIGNRPTELRPATIEEAAVFYTILGSKKGNSIDFRDLAINGILTDAEKNEITDAVAEVCQENQTMQAAAEIVKSIRSHE